jgi:hypothetical protein
MGGSDTEEESESARDSTSNAEGYTDPLDEHLLMAPNGHEQGAMENVESAYHVTEAVVGSSQVQEPTIMSEPLTADTIGSE